MTGRKLLLAVLLAVLFVLIYRSPEDNLREERISEAIEIGRLTAWALYNGYTYLLNEINLDEPAWTKVRTHGFKRLSPQEVLRIRGKNISGNLSFGVLYPHIDALKLLALDRRSSFVVVTFGYTDLGRVLEIPGRGKLLFAVCLRYVRPFDESLSGRLLRKLANLPVVKTFETFARYGTTGKWFVIDYKLNGYVVDYYEWLLAHGEEATTLDSSEWKKFKEKSKKDALDESARQRFIAELDKKIDSLYEWSARTAEEQMLNVASR